MIYKNFKPQELRLGNFILMNGDLIATVEDISTSKGVVGRVQGATLHTKADPESKGILLTEKWLIKLGFQETTFGRWGNKKSRIEGLSDAMYIQVEGETVEFIVNSNPYDSYEIPIPYIHTLQNVYFTLTGEELAIK